jgi:peptidoglycan hydrolase-like protein with peptidoglycan-binding domain
MATRFYWLALTIGGLIAATPPPAKKTTPPPQAKSKTNRRPRVKAAVGGAPKQAAPTSERFREIQEALISKGYLQGPANGLWDQNSIDAMKKFQQDQKLDATGKITSRALISLGLGPKDESGITATSK